MQWNVSTANKKVKSNNNEENKNPLFNVRSSFYDFSFRQNSSCINNHFQDASPLICMPVQVPCTCKIH